MLYLFKDGIEIIDLYQIFAPDLETPSVKELDRIANEVLKLEISPESLDISTSFKRVLVNAGYQVTCIDFYILGV